jgi:murein DD-endopeptidase MepM/ murein hydrolase activator NlpD
MIDYPPLGRAAAVAALAISGAVAALAAIAPPAELLLGKTARIEPVALAAQGSVLPEPQSYFREELLQRGDTVPALLARLGIGEADAAALGRLRPLRYVRPGTTVAAEVRADGELLELSFLASPDTLVRIERDGSQLRSREERAALETRVLMKFAEIRSSLFAAADVADIPDAVALQLAEIFGGDIDFHRDLRRGDRFSVVYEMQHFEGRPVRSGRVLAAEFVNHGKTHRAVWYAGSAAAAGRGGYYAPDGKSLRKAFLRSPLEFSRISSGFGVRRHPFLQTWRKHQGVDYAAPAGTRVRAVGDGVVHFVGREGGYGNVVVLRHQGQYSTLYAHLRGFARGIRQGARVAQGEALGFVGQTGWATGPHLHYEFRVAGMARDPLAVKLPAAVPLAAQEMGAFRADTGPLARVLELLAGSEIALLE